MDSLTSLFLWDRSTAARLKPNTDFKKVSLKLNKDIPIIVLGRSKAEVRKLWALAVVSKKSLTAELAMKLLKQNARTKMGAWTIEQNANGDYLVIFCVKIDATASAEATTIALPPPARAASVSRRLRAFQGSSVARS